MNAVADIAIVGAVVGAGPYEVSLAARLAGRGDDLRAVARPMRIGLRRMPKGMHLRSDRFASSLRRRAR